MVRIVSIIMICLLLLGSSQTFAQQRTEHEIKDFLGTWIYANPQPRVNKDEKDKKKKTSVDNKQSIGVANQDNDTLTIEQKNNSLKVKFLQREVATYGINEAISYTENRMSTLHSGYFGRIEEGQLLLECNFRFTGESPVVPSRESKEVFYLKLSDDGSILTVRFVQSSRTYSPLIKGEEHNDPTMQEQYMFYRKH